MLDSWIKMAAPAVQERLVLLGNHVLSREPVAQQRLARITGRAVVVHVAGAPGFLPAPPDLVLAVTPAGLFERLDAAPPESLRVEIDGSQPWQLAMSALGVERPRVTVQGDAAVASELSWLIENLRWDIEDDLAGVVGPLPARQIVRFARSARDAIGALAKTVAASAGGLARKP
ncbi:hypothetical protein [Roseateles sp.]|uniref:hypothetical protein n=1 Tax=Roseateles sp. TaxID=1971397 RepID=UPI003957D32E